MKNVLQVFALTFLSCGIIATQIGCSNDDDNTTAPVEQEFVAADADITNYSTWTTTAKDLAGPDPAGLIGGAHEANNVDIRRTVFINKTGVKSNGKWAKGTILIKEMRNVKTGALLGVMGMVKRGVSFNAEHNGWEWFFINDGKIGDRGAGLMNGMCNGCHSSLKSKYDYVFTKE